MNEFPKEMMPAQPPQWHFWLARMLGKKLTPWSYYWRGKYWLMEGAPLGVPLDGREPE